MSDAVASNNLLEISGQSEAVTGEIKDKLNQQDIPHIEGDQSLFLEEKNIDAVKALPGVVAESANIQIREANAISDATEKKKNLAQPLFELANKEQALLKIADEASQEKNMRAFINANIQILQNHLAIDKEAQQQLDQPKKFLRDEYHPGYVELFGKVGKKDFPEKFAEKHLLTEDRKQEISNEVAGLKEQLATLSTFASKEETTILKNEEFTRPRAEPKSAASDEIEKPAGSEKSEIPFHLKNTYFYSGEKIFQTGASPKHIFTDQRSRLVLHDKEPMRAQIQHLIDLAEAKKWTSIKVTGTNEFKSQVWLEASLRNLNVEGYKPSKVELDQLAALRKDKAPANENENAIERGTEQKKSHVAEARPENFAREKEAVASNNENSKEAANNNVRSFYGTLLEHGSAPYEFKDGNKLSPFVRLKLGAEREHIVWGVDLPRAIKEGSAKIGDAILLEDLGKQKVTIQEEIKDATGNVIGEKDKVVDRHVWKATAKQAESDREDRKTKILALFDQSKTPSDLLKISLQNPQYDELRNIAAVYHLSVDRSGKDLSDAAKNRLNSDTRKAIRSAIQEGREIAVQIKETKDVSQQFRVQKTTKSSNQNQGTQR